MIKNSLNNINFLVYSLQNLIESWSSDALGHWQSNQITECLESINLSLLSDSEMQLSSLPSYDKEGITLIISQLTNNIIVPGLFKEFQLQKFEWTSEKEQLLLKIQELQETKTLRTVDDMSSSDDSTSSYLETTDSSDSSDSEEG
ncbi:hypothetical protein GEMRC1_005076 [Eukaryota sp. GEM-RC1]